MDTIFALSSGSPPAAIGIIRMSGKHAKTALEKLAGKLPEPRRAVARRLEDSNGRMLDHALVLWLPGPHTFTGEDCAELHVHGGRAVVTAIQSALGSISGLRPAEAGEFTRRAFANGRLDLAEAEGLADLLAAETELQRQSAISLASGALSNAVENWRTSVLALSAQVEAALDFSDEDDVSELPKQFHKDLRRLVQSLSNWLERPRGEKLREGFRVVLAGPPNAGKSTLFNALVGDDAAITADTAGTTRDVLERPIAFDGVPFVFIDTAGLRGESQDAIETIGIDRAKRQMDRADIILWLGEEGEAPENAIDVSAKADVPSIATKIGNAIPVSAVSGAGISELQEMMVDRARRSLPKPGMVALNQRQAELIETARNALQSAMNDNDLLLTAEKLRETRVAFDRLIGRASTEDMLDNLFGKFCIGK